MRVWEHTPADHATYAAFWRWWLAQLEGVCISRAALGVAAGVSVCRNAAEDDTARWSAMCLTES